MFVAAWQPTTTCQGPRSARGFPPHATLRCTDLAEPLGAQLAPIGELVASIPAPCGDHRQHEEPARAQHVVINPWIVVADIFGRMGKVEFDRPTATRLQVDEESARSPRALPINDTIGVAYYLRRHGGT